MENVECPSRRINTIISGWEKVLNVSIPLKSRPNLMKEYANSFTKWLIDNISNTNEIAFKRGKDSLRDLQYHILKALPNNSIEELKFLIPFYFKPADIMLFYNIDNHSLSLFYLEKYNSHWDGTPIKADIVQIIGWLEGRTFYAEPVYYIFKDYQLTSPCGDKARIANNEFMWPVKEYVNTLKNYYDNNKLFACIFDKSKPRYVTENKIDSILIKDLLSIYWFYLNQ